MDIIKSIQQRKSCRTFTAEDIKPSDRTELEKFMANHRNGVNNESIDFLVFRKDDSEEKLKIPYGLIRGNKTYIFGKTHLSPISRTNYGYLLEHVVLKATDMGLGTCWVGLFDSEYFSDIKVESELSIPGILVIGYAEEKIPLKEKLIRKAVKADKRKPWSTLFFDYETLEVLKPESVPSYEESLQMTRLAPSSGNTQPWRIFHSAESKAFHFYKKPTNASYELKGMHDIDLGIAICHFEQVSIKNGLSGKWEILPAEGLKQINESTYVISWKYF